MHNISEANSILETGMYISLMDPRKVEVANVERDNSGLVFKIMEGSSGIITLPDLIEIFILQ